MSITPGTPSRRRWITNMRWIAALLGVWFVVTFVVAFFARDLSMRIFDWPFAYWVASQGAPIAYVLITVVYAWRTNRAADAAEHDAEAAQAPAQDQSRPPSI
jgi:putative solute:sodium symporter small subunit